MQDKKITFQGIEFDEVREYKVSPDAKVVVTCLVKEKKTGGRVYLNALGDAVQDSPKIIPELYVSINAELFTAIGDEDDTKGEWNTYDSRGLRFIENTRTKEEIMDYIKQYINEMSRGLQRKIFSGERQESEFSFGFRVEPDFDESED